LRVVRRIKRTSDAVAIVKEETKIASAATASPAPPESLIAQASFFCFVISLVGSACVSALAEKVNGAIWASTANSWPDFDVVLNTLANSSSFLAEGRTAISQNAFAKAVANIAYVADACDAIVVAILVTYFVVRNTIISLLFVACFANALPIRPKAIFGADDISDT